MKRWHLIAIAVVCFGAGVISATVYDGVAREERPRRHGELYSGLADRLNLTDRQQQRLDEIVQEARLRLVALSRETKPRFRQIKRNTRDRVREILDAEQLAIFNEICASCDRRKRIE